MNELTKIKAQIDQGQGLTCAQAQILWDAMNEASRYAGQALRNVYPANLRSLGLQNAYTGLQSVYAAMDNNAYAQWQPSEELLAQFWPGRNE